MQQITGSKKYQNGIQVFWSGEGKDNAEFFTYEDLITQNINVFDLLVHPGIYRIDPDKRLVESNV